MITKPPASLTTLTEDGYLVTVIDRAPLAGEQGWWVNPGTPLEDTLLRVVIDNARGWLSHGEEYARAIITGLKLVTIERDLEPEPESTPAPTFVYTLPAATIYLGYDGSYVLSETPFVLDICQGTRFLTPLTGMCFDAGEDAARIFGYLKLKKYEQVRLDVTPVWREKATNK